MIDEPLTLLAEAFGHDLEPALPPLTGGEAAVHAASDGPQIPAAIASIAVRQIESGGLAARTGQAGWA